MDPHSDQDTPILLTEKEVARLLGFSPRTLQKWRVTGAGPRHLKISARCCRYRMRDVEEWMEQRVRRSTSDDGEKQ